MLDLPQIFQQDIQGKDTFLIPLINIDDRVFLSISKVSLDNDYKPLLKDTGSVNQALDLKDKKLKISSVSISAYNYEYQDSYLSEQLFAPSVMNKKITFYLKSQSAKSIDDCLLVYSGYVKQISENADTITIEAEDETQDVMNTELPTRFVPDNINLPDRYKNVRIPFVYGIVDKAPCVYYDLYATTIQNGSRDYAISPDLFAIQDIKKPYVFDNNTYGEITEDTLHFDEEKSGTLFKNAVEGQQYQILGNRILVPKSIDVHDNLETTDGLIAPITAFGMVEVQVISDLNFNTSKFRLDYEETGGTQVSGKTFIQSYTSPEATTPSSVLQNSYLLVTDFSSESNQEFPFEFWYYGNNTAHTSGYNNIYGESVINFEAKQFFSSSNIVSELVKNVNGDTKDIVHSARLLYNLDANVQRVSDGLPILYFQYTDTGSELWNMNNQIDEENVAFDEFTINSGVYGTGGLPPYNNFYGQISPYTKTKTPADNKVIIGQRSLVGENWQPQDMKGIINWLKINDLKLVRNVILKDFINYDIYADVNGRVDDIAGTYTGTPQLTAGERVQVNITRAPEEQPSVYKPVVKPRVKLPTQVSIKPAAQVQRVVPTKPLKDNLIRAAVRKQESVRTQQKRKKKQETKY